jgi:hypothetical protein
LKRESRIMNELFEDSFCDAEIIPYLVAPYF